MTTVDSHCYTLYTFWKFNQHVWEWILSFLLQNWGVCVMAVNWTFTINSLNLQIHLALSKDAQAAQACCLFVGKRCSCCMTRPNSSMDAEFVKLQIHKTLPAFYTETINEEYAAGPGLISLWHVSTHDLLRSNCFNKSAVMYNIVLN